MELFHTSQSEITNITSSGRFGEFLCFSDHVYAMSAGEVITYKIDINENDIIWAGDMLYHDDAEKLQPLTEQVMDLAGCDEDTADDLLSQKTDVGQMDLPIAPEDLADVSWDIQRLTAKAAKMLGFRGVAMKDEQGTCYMIDMLGHEADLERV